MRRFQRFTMIGIILVNSVVLGDAGALAQPRTPTPTLHADTGSRSTNIHVDNWSSLPNPRNGSFYIRVGQEVMRVTDGGTGSSAGRTLYVVDRGMQGTTPTAHARGAPITHLHSHSHALTARLEIAFPNIQGRDFIDNGGYPCLILITRPEVTPSDQGMISKQVTLWVKDWISNSAEPVTVEIKDGAGKRILLDWQIPNNLPNKMRVHPPGDKDDLIHRTLPANMHKSASGEYGFGISFSVMRGATPGLTPIELIARQGRHYCKVHLHLLVTTEFGSPVPLAPIGGTDAVAPTFRWVPVMGASRYEVEVFDLRRARVLHTTGVGGNFVAPQTWTANTFLVKGQTYTWRVRPLATNGTPGPWSEVQTFTVGQPAVRTTPDPVSAKDLGGGNVLLSWTDVDFEDRYAIEFWDAPNHRWVHLTTTAANATSQQITNGTGKFWRVGAAKTGDVTRYSQWAIAGSAGGTNLPNATLPGIPAQLDPEGTIDVLAPTFRWNPVAGASRYEVVVQNAARVRVLHTTGVGATANAVQSWTADAFLTAGQTYTWWVKAIATDGTAGGWSAGKTFTVERDDRRTPDPLSWTLVGVGPDITLSWTPAKDTERYVIEYWDAANRRWLTLTTLGGAATSSRVTNGVGQTLRVGAARTGRPTEYSRPYSIGGQGSTNLPPAPGELQWMPGEGTAIGLQWTKVSEATNYVIEYRTTSGWASLATFGADVTRVTIPSGHGFSYRVGARNGSGTNFSPPIHAKR